MFDALNSFLDNTANTQAQANGTLYSLSPSVPNVLDYFYKNLETLGYNLVELKPALEQTVDATSVTRSTLIISCAGSGKTTFLVLKLIRDYLAGELFSENGTLIRVFISTFLKTGAEELKNSFDEKCTELNVKGVCADSFTFSTLHSEYYSILTSIGIKIQIMPEDEAMQALEKCCNSLCIRNKAKGGYKLSRDELADIACIVTYARNRIDEQRYKHPLVDEYGIKPAILDKLIELFHKHRKAVSSYDFEDLQELVYQGIITNPQFMQFVMNRYDYVLIDEFQDTSQIQYEILKAYINGAKRTIAIGDDDQCIYSWRGSDVDIITKRFPADYNPVIHKFTVNYRCGANILAPVVASIKHNTNRYEKNLAAYRSGGSVSVNKTCNVDSLMADVKTAIQRQNTVGILSRTNFDLLAPAILLELDGSIPFSVSKSVGISSYIPKTVFGCLKLLTRRYSDDFESILKNFCSRYTAKEATIIADILQNQTELSLDTLKSEDLAYSCPTLYRVLFAPMRAAKSKKDAYLDMLRFLMKERFTGESPFNVRARMFISFVYDLIQNHSMLKNLTLSEIDELFTDVIPVRLNKRAYGKTERSSAVRLTTVHEAKGKEWQTVILWNDTQGVFPALVGNHDITVAEYEEERRLHYIAFTRAKEQLIVYSSETAPSPFLQECDFNASLEAEVIASELASTQELPRKQGQVSQDLFTDVLQECINGQDCELRSEVMNILAHFEYDMDKMFATLKDKYTALYNAGVLSSANGDINAEFALVVKTMMTEIMQTAFDAALAAVPYHSFS